MGKICSFDIIKDLVGAKWTADIIYKLVDGPESFSNLERKLPGISHKVLAVSGDSLENLRYLLAFSNIVAIHYLSPNKVLYSYLKQLYSTLFIKSIHSGFLLKQRFQI